jgi:AhpD family alkylhydroperoxidase
VQIRSDVKIPCRRTTFDVDTVETMTTTATATDQPVIPAPRSGDVTGVERAYGAMAKFDQSITLDHQLRELIKLRASVLNGCSFCVDMHTTDARAAGETDRRLASVAAWHHAPFFTARERAALALTDAMTNFAPEGVPDAVWEEAKANIEPEELGQLVMAITAINSWNRLAITFLTTPPLD